MQTDSSQFTPADIAVLARYHLRFGWWSLLFFLTLGIVLEALHGFKVDFYLNVANETRRLMWTLAHAHGTLLALVHIAFAFTLPSLAALEFRRRKLISACLTAASILLPGGFFLSGIFIYGGDPGLSILLVPVGAVLLLAAVLFTARALTVKPIAAAKAPLAAPSRPAAAVKPRR